MCSIVRCHVQVYDGRKIPSLGHLLLRLSQIDVTVATIVGDVENYVTVVLRWIMDQCDSLITK